VDDSTRRLHPGFEHPRDQAEKPLVGDALCQDGKNLSMWHRVERYIKLIPPSRIHNRTPPLKSK
jgi:hypothetical protein